MIKRTLLTLLLLLSAGSAVAAWHVVPCDGTALARRASFAAAVHQARAGGTPYTPKAFPKNDADVVADLVQQITDIYDRPNSTGVFRPLAQGMRE